MGETTQRLGFDASKAIASLKNFGSAVVGTEAKLRGFNREAERTAKIKMAERLKKFIPVAKTMSQQWGKMGEAASKSASKQVTAAKKVTKAGHGMTVTWQTLARVVGTQVLLRGFGMLTATMQEATDKARDFGLAIEEIQTIAGNALGASSTLAGAITQIGNELGVTSDQVAEGAYQVLSNQIGSASESMNTLVVSQKLATITGSSTAAAVNAISSVLNSYEMSADQASKVSDVLFKTVELGRLRLEDIANVLGRVTPLTAALGISFEETAAAVAVMTRQGVKADTAITQLRAITQKLIKPTEKMQALFRKWGVESGPQAIKTFGGLEGVLSKLAKETDNNSTEMATYFNRVRAIVGQMSAMTGEGKRLRDTQAEIKDSTDAASEAWERFTGSDAFRLQKAQAQFNNELTRSGSALTAFAIGWNVVKTSALSALTDITDGVSSTFAKFQDRLVKITRETGSLAEEAAKNVKVVTQEQLNELLEFERKHLAEVGKAWFAANDKIEKNTKTMIAGIKGALDEMLKGFEDKFKPIKDFVKGQQTGKGNESLIKKQEKAKQDLAKSDREKEDKRKTPFQQVDDRFSEANKSGAKSAVQFANAFTKAQEDAAEASQEVAMNLANEGLQLAMNTKNIVKIREAEELRRKILKSGIKARDVAIKNRAKILPITEKIQQSVEAQAKARKEINSQIVAELKTLSKTDTAEDEQSSQARLKELFTELKTFSLPDRAQEVFKAFGIQDLPAELQAQLNAKTFTIETEVKVNLGKIQDQLNKINTEMQKRLDPTGAKGQATEKLLGRGQKKGEGFNQFLAKGYEEAEKAAKKFSLADQEVIKQLSNEAQAQKIVNEVQVQQNELLAKKQAELRKTNAPLAPVGGVLYGRDLQENTLQDIAGPALKLRDLFGELNTQLENGNPLVKDQVTALNLYTQAVRNSAVSTKEDIILAAASNAALKNRNAELKRSKLLQDQQAKNKPKQKKADNLLDLAAKDTERTKNALGIMEKQSAAIAGHIRDFAAAASTALGNTGGLVTGWNAVTKAVEASATAAVAAIQKIAQAKAAAAAATAEFRGGYQTLAHGGSPTQGQDTIPALLSPGEFVVNSASSGKFFSELNAINSGTKPAFREQGGSVTNVGDVNVAVNGGDSSSQTVREIGNALRREIKRGTIKLN